jgi:hypothetical protein
MEIPPSGFIGSTGFAVETLRLLARDLESRVWAVDSKSTASVLH